MLRHAHLLFMLCSLIVAGYGNAQPTPHIPAKLDQHYDISRDGRRIAYSTGNTLIVSDLVTGEVLQEWGFTYRVQPVAISGDGTHAFGVNERSIYRFNIETGEYSKFLDGYGFVYAIATAFRPDQILLRGTDKAALATEADDTVHVHVFEDSANRGNIDAGGIYTTESLNMSLFDLGSGNYTLYTVDGQVSQKFRDVTAAAVNRSGTQIALITRSHSFGKTEFRLRTFDVAAGEFLASVMLESSDPPHRALFFPNNDILMLGPSHAKQRLVFFDANQLTRFAAEIETPENLEPRFIPGSDDLLFAGPYDAPFILSMAPVTAQVDAVRIAGEVVVATPSEFFSIVRNGRWDAVEAAIDAGADVSMTDEYGQTPLMYAAGAGNDEVIRLLLDAGANVNAASATGWTPLMYAAREATASTVEILLANGANVAVVNADQQSAHDLANPEAQVALDAHIKAEQQREFQAQMSNQVTELVDENIRELLLMTNVDGGAVLRELNSTDSPYAIRITSTSSPWVAAWFGNSSSRRIYLINQQEATWCLWHDTDASRFQGLGHRMRLNYTNVDRYGVALITVQAAWRSTVLTPFEAQAIFGLRG